ncbi:hypothetical protein ABE426_08490 [Sphingobacterium faecium]|uniref:hypothetical protein n=1 Tax=Sphingobacterium faecium TaxID=34087 RepID=UPI0032082821
MKKIIKKISGVIQVILLAPVKLPGKFINIIKYIGLGLGILESVIVEKDEQDQQEEGADAGVEHTQLVAGSNSLDPTAKSVSNRKKVLDGIIKYDLETGKEVVNEME